MLEAYEELFDEIIKIARVRGVKFGQLQGRSQSLSGA